MHWFNLCSITSYHIISERLGIRTFNSYLSFDSNIPPFNDTSLEIHWSGHDEIDWGRYCAWDWLKAFRCCRWRFVSVWKEVSVATKNKWCRLVSHPRAITMLPPKPRLQTHHELSLFPKFTGYWRELHRNREGAVVKAQRDSELRAHGRDGALPKVSCPLSTLRHNSSSILTLLFIGMYIC